MKLKKIMAAVISAAMAATIVTSSIVPGTAADNTFTDLDQSQIVYNMGAGWNLGNALEASSNGIPNETTWGNPVITRELIHTVKTAGFKSIRIPVSYLKYIGKGPDYTIDASWLNRVKEVVDYAIDEGLYVIMNIHGDGYYTVDHGWLLCAEPEDAQVEIKAKYAACWEQIANLYKDYDEHLIFESMNEVFDGKYSGQNFSAYENINDYNQIFVDTVRKTGGNNAKRWLLVPGWNTDIDQTVSSQGGYSFKIPTDTYLDNSISGKRIMISVHYYNPWDFCGDGTSGAYSQWGSDANPLKTTSYGNTEEAMETQIKKVYDKFVTEGYPVVIGEYGCINKTASDPVNNLYRAHYNKTVCELSKKYGCVPVYWDNGAVSDSFGLINRKTNEIAQPEIIDAMMSVYLTPQENLERFISMVSTLDSNCYTSETWTPFETALTAAKNASEDKYQEAYDALNEAYYCLVPNENYQKDQEIISENDVSDSASIEDPEKYIVSIEPALMDISASKKIVLKFKIVSGTVNSGDTVFILKPYSNKNWDGWNDNFVKLSDCTYDSASKEYSVTLDPQKILASYGGKDPDGAKCINLYYGIKDSTPVIQLTSYSASVPTLHTVHHYVLTEKTEICSEYKCTVCGEEYTDVYTDKSRLSLAISKASAYEESDYTPESYKALADALEAAMKIELDSEATQTQINDAVKALNAAIAGLVKKSSSNPSVTTTKKSATTTAKTTAAVVKKPATVKKVKAVSKKKKTLKVTWKKQSGVKGYIVQAASKKSFKNKTIVAKKTLNKNTAKVNLKTKKIKSGKKYFVRVRAYKTYTVNGVTKQVSGPWSKKVKSAKVK